MDNIKIKNSYKVPKRNFKPALDGERQLRPDSLVWTRTYNSLYREWALHNACYLLGLWRSRTKDVDLNAPQRWYEKLIYSVGGIVVWLFIP